MQRDIARALGISQVAVSMALRNNPDISAALRKKIQACAEQMGYRPNPAATALAHSRSCEGNQPVQAALAWLNCWPVPEQLRRYRTFEQYWQGAQASADKLGYRLEEFVCNGQLAPRRLETMLVARGIPGILLPPHAVQPDWGNFSWNRFSVVRLGRSITEPGGHVVTADQVANTLLAVEKIRARGYRRIGFVGFDSLEDTRWLFEAGFLRAQMGMPPKERVPILGLDRLNPRASRPALLRWLKKERPDAVLTVCPPLHEMLAQCGYRVPDDIGLAAVSVVDPPIDAGIDQNALEIGRVSVLTLNSLIHDQALGIPESCRQILIPGTWVDGSMLPVRS